MSVYVDDMHRTHLGRFGRMRMSHMVADTHRELVEMADRIGVARRWIQKPGSSDEHFDICKSKRALAVKNGALEVTMLHCAQLCGDRRGEAGRRAYFEGQA